jgi:GMP synthase (glutamine-hydrolysing)
MKKPLKILVLDSTRLAESFGSKDLVQWALKEAPVGSEVMVRRAPDSDLPTRDLRFDAILLSGSITSCFEMKESWIRPFHDYVTFQLQKSTPILGVCYGFQALARCLAEIAGTEPKFSKSAQPELGWQTIHQVSSSPIFEGLPENFVSSESHYEEVAEVPPGTKLIAETNRCRIQGFEVIGKPVFAVQFHPEHTVEGVEESLAKKLKKGERKDWILNAGKGSKLYNDQVGKTIFGNFFRIADSKRQ